MSFCDYDGPLDDADLQDDTKCPFNKHIVGECLISN
jgi:hypothetical protein